MSVPPLSRLVAGLLVLVLVAACGALPKPFQRTKTDAPNPLVEAGVPRDIAINLVRGPAGPMAKLLSQSVADELNRYGIVAYVGDRGTSPFVIDGWVEGWRGGQWLSPPLVIRWVMTERDGSLVGSHRENVFGTAFEWDYGSPRIIREVGAHTGAAFAGALQVSLPGAKAAAVPIDGIWIKPILDAPGDGNFSLTQAVQFALGDAGLRVSPERERARFVLRGSVRVDSPESGSQNVKITWIVTNRNDHELGRATQRNKVPAGTFDGRWGQTAVFIAAAAVGAIQGIVARGDNQLISSGNQPLSVDIEAFDAGAGPVLPPPTLTPDSGTSEPSEPPTPARE